MDSTANTAENFSHPVRCESVEIHYVKSTTTLHKAGCQHRADQKSATMDAAKLVSDTLTIYRDDFYNVAPCARKA